MANRLLYECIVELGSVEIAYTGRRTNYKET